MGVEYFVIFYHKHVHTKHVFFWLHSMLIGNATSVGPIKKEEIPNVNCAVRFHDFLFGPTSNWKSKQNTKKKNKKNKSPTSMSHVGDRSSIYARHVEYQHPTSTSHVEGKNLAYVSHVGG
jgi:hypothetical protein